MVKAIVAERAGPPDVLSIKTINLKLPRANEVLVKNEAIGLNFIDIQVRSGAYSGIYPFEFPGILGCEAAGVVESVGDHVKDFKPGDRVAYATTRSGGYAEKKVIDQSRLVPLPDDISFEDAAAVLLKGMTAHYLLRRTFFVGKSNIILVYAAAGGTGQLLCKLAMHYGATVIGVVRSDEKAKVVKSLGVNMVINSTKEDVVESVMAHTSKQGVHVVYDSIGKDTFQASLKCLCDFGLMVSFGSSSGSIPPFDPNLLKERCLFLTMPNLFVYKRNRVELLLSANEVFCLLRDKVIAPNIYRRYSFDQIREAHADIESGKTTGQCLLVTGEVEK